MLKMNIRGKPHSLTGATITSDTFSVSSGAPLTKLRPYLYQDALNTLAFGRSFRKFQFKEREVSMYLTLSKLWGDLKEGDKPKHEHSGSLAYVKGGSLIKCHNDSPITTGCALKCLWEKVVPEVTYGIGDWFQGASGRLYILSYLGDSYVQLIDTERGQGYASAIRVSNSGIITENELKEIVGGFFNYFELVEAKAVKE